MRQLAAKGFSVFIIFLLVFVCLNLSSCSSQEGEETGKDYTVYYLDADGTGLVGQTVPLQDDSGDVVNTLTMLLQKLQEDSEDGKCRRAISPDIHVNNFQMKENRLAVYFTAVYNNKVGLDEVLSRAAIVKTLCQAEGVEYVEFFVEDQPLMVNGTAVGLMSADNFIMDFNDDRAEKSKQVTLYFADENGEKLRSMSAKVTYNAAEPLARMLVQKLIDGPGSIPDVDTSHIISTIPADTVLNSATIRNNICYLDLSREFLSMKADVSSDVVVYSIVNTLCELPNVSKVQFLIDGEPQDKYGETLDFYLPFDRNLELILGGTTQE